MNHRLLMGLNQQWFTNLDRVEALAEDLLDFTSVGDLEQWLAA